MNLVGNVAFHPKRKRAVLAYNALLISANSYKIRSFRVHRNAGKVIGR